MNHQKIILKAILFIGVWLLLSCNRDEEIALQYYPFQQPSNFPSTVYNFDQYPGTYEGFELGRKLFYDVRLSSDNSVSCANCHDQAFAFTHHGHDISAGVNELTGTRNAPPLHNLAYLKELGWDGSVSHLVLQPIVPITATFEMNETLGNVVNKLKVDATYISMFNKAFSVKTGESSAVNNTNLLRALGQFMAAMVSANSKFDKFERGEAGGIFTTSENKGYVLFKAKCASCHSGTLFTNQEYINNGLGVNSRFPNELGRAALQVGMPLAEAKNHTDYFKFRVPSLRNIAVTFPYMHDGSIPNLKKVLDFYDTDTAPDMKAMFNLDSRLNNNGTLGIPLTEEEKNDIISFLNTLTDNQFLKDVRFSHFK